MQIFSGCLLAFLSLLAFLFTFDTLQGEGHLHVMVNGEKLERIYGGDLHIAALPEGDVIISVAAFTNDHRPYTVAGNPAQAATSITVESA